MQSTRRLPKVLGVFLTGAIDVRMVIALVRCTRNVDDEVIARLDGLLATRVVEWMRMSGPKLEERIDMWVTKVDPEGVREPRTSRDGRCVDFRSNRDGTIAEISGRLPMADGLALDLRIDELAATVCREDPRTKEQRRADALCALGTGQTVLPCECGTDTCPAAGVQHPPLSTVVIHVLADQASLEGRSAQPGYSPGFGPVATPLLEELATSAKLKPLQIPPPTAEPQYRPSAALAEFIRWRDLTCRAPGCHVPAEHCEIDHTIPWPLGPTHPSNNKLYCKFHHLWKTFWFGAGGWSEHQLPDGTLILTAPTGHTYTTKPAGALFFPALAIPTGTLIIPENTTEPSPYRGLMMPRRKRTRAQDRAYRIALERQHNAQRIAQQDKLRAEQIAHDYEPPPF